MSSSRVLICAVLLGLLGGLGGCSDVLYGSSRLISGYDCRPEVTKGGPCVVAR